MKAASSNGGAVLLPCTRASKDSGSACPTWHHENTCLRDHGLIKIPGLPLKVKSQNFGLVAIVFAAKFELQSRSPVAALVDKLRHALGASSDAGPVMACTMSPWSSTPFTTHNHGSSGCRFLSCSMTLAQPSLVPSPTLADLLVGQPLMQNPRCESYKCSQAKHCAGSGLRAGHVWPDRKACHWSPHLLTDWRGCSLRDRRDSQQISQRHVQLWVE